MATHQHETFPSREEVLKFHAKLPGGKFPLYKSNPPFMPIEKGYGFQGVILWDSSTDLIQCHICGGWFKGLVGHVRHKHKMDFDDYKKSAGLGKRVSCVSFSTREKMAEATRAKIARDPEGFKRQMKNMLSAAAKARRLKPKTVGRISLRNRRSTCDAQIKERVREIGVKLGRTPKLHELPSGLRETIHRRGFSMHDLQKSAGFKPLVARYKLTGKYAQKNQRT